VSSYQQTTPARLTEPATRKLPRIALLIVGALYIFAGLFFRDPWKTNDLTGMATMMDAYRESAWLLPQIGNFAFAQEGPLTTWMGALSIGLFSPLFGVFTDPLTAQITAARLPTILYFFLLLWGVWHGTYLLARRPECQPLPLPFGGEPHPRDYGRMLADVAFLFILATIGIIIPIHETSSFPLLLALFSIAFYGLARMLDHPVQGSIILGLALAGSLLTHGFIGATPILFMVACALVSRVFTSHDKLTFLITLFLGAGCFLAWFIPAQATNPYWTSSWLHWNYSSFGFSNPQLFLKSLRDLLWFTWPTWPFALIALWNWRKWLRAPHIFIPGTMALGSFLTIALVKDAFEPEYAMLTVPFAVLAAMSIPTLRRNIINTQDWFSIMILSLSMITVWLGWIALHFGWPQQINHNITRLLTGYEPRISPLALLAAIVVSILWYSMVSWRLRINPQALWRGLILSAAGLTCTWILLALLWLPSINYNRSYKQVSQELEQALETHVKPGECVREQGLGMGQRAALRVFENITFTYDTTCKLVLLQTTRQHLKERTLPYADNARILWQGSRKSERHEIFLLLHLDK
jgi:4-amino-4-deoxy-L-arabinose transferase-like glycosyltransferase